MVMMMELSQSPHTHTHTRTHEREGLGTKENIGSFFFAQEEIKISISPTDTHTGSQGYNSKLVRD